MRPTDGPLRQGQRCHAAIDLERLLDLTHQTSLELTLVQHARDHDHSENQEGEHPENLELKA